MATAQCSSTLGRAKWLSLLLRFNGQMQPNSRSRRAAAAGDGRLHPRLITPRAATVACCSLLLSRRSPAADFIS